MGSNKPGLPKGTRDFLPQQSLWRAYIFDTVKEVFQRYGYAPIETPSIENLSTLMGKYGEEGDKLIFKIINSGDYLAKANNEAYQSGSSSLFTASISEKALRYDLTVPFARFVVQNQNELNFPFKRYQIQPVWRADRPQKGRYREFYQCDVDVIGSRSLLNEVELVQIINEVFKNLNITGVIIKLNNRKILAGLAAMVGATDQIIDITVALDKIDKIGVEKVIEELKQRGISNESIEKLKPLLNFEGGNKDKLSFLSELLNGIEIGEQGIQEIEYVINTVESLGETNVEIDLTLARGLNYYTGAIFEVVTDGFSGSICGGGRYDDLTGIFGLKDVSGVGVSFGADRIYDILRDNNLFPESVVASSEVLFVNFGENEASYCLKLVSQLRKNGISAELYPDNVKMKKQMKYADGTGVRYVILAGASEIESDKVQVKDMQTGEQIDVKSSELLKFIQSK